VDVHLVHAESYLELCVDDNGRGLPAGAADDPYSLGLVSMRERMAQLGGSVYFDSAPGQGTRVTFRMPVAGES
jgi:two-component system sensor histidine kinase UhpB